MFSFFRQNKLDKAIMDDDVDSMEKLLRVSDISGKPDRASWRLNWGRSGQDSLLHRAAYSNSVKVARLMIDSGGEVDAKNGVGDTPLHVAARYNAWETADLLLRRGARMDLRNKVGQTPLDVAVNNGNCNLAELLRLVGKQSADG